MPVLSRPLLHALLTFSVGASTHQIQHPLDRRARLYDQKLSGCLTFAYTPADAVFVPRRGATRVTPQTRTVQLSAGHN